MHYDMALFFQKYPLVLSLSKDSHRGLRCALT